MPNHNDMCESINAMVDNIRKRSPNISLFRAVQVVHFRKNAKCLGATTVENIYKVLGKFENEDFVNEVKDYVHGRHKFSPSQRQEAEALKEDELAVEKRCAEWRQIKLQNADGMSYCKGIIGPKH